MKPTVTIAHGDGIGPEIMQATLDVVTRSGAELNFEEIEIGQQVYRSGHTSGISDEAWDVLRRNRVFLKSPITTPQGCGYKSLNVTIRKTLGLFANVRPCVAYHPFLATNHPSMDVVIIRENEEDTYAGIEHQQTGEVAQCLKLISRPGCERICRFAFEFAKANGRKRVTCMTKDNIMKLTDGMFHDVFDEVASDYNDIKSEHLIIDIGTAKLATNPAGFDVVVAPNLYGDIISDVAAELTGSVGLAGSANIGDGFAMFEAIHGSAPDISGKGIANPSGLLHAAIMMLVHVGQSEAAEKIHNAWLKTIEQGIHTGDVSSEKHTKETVNTTEFASAVIDRLGEMPDQLGTVTYDRSSNLTRSFSVTRSQPKTKEIVGVDVFIHQNEVAPEKLASQLQQTSDNRLEIKLITNRGVKVWPNGFPETFCTDHWRCRFKKTVNNGYTLSHDDIIGLLGRIQAKGLDFIKIENLCELDGKPAYSLGQGE